MTLKVSKINGKEFDATFHPGDNQKRIIHGTFVDNKVKWLAKDTKANPGNEGNDNYGDLNTEGDRAKIEVNCELKNGTSWKYILFESK